MSMFKRTADVVTNLLSPQSAANTAAATTAFVDVRGYEGEVTVRLHTGAVTGSITYTFQTATDSGGTGVRTITPLGGAPALISAANIQDAVFNSRDLDGFIKVIGTIVTGPVLVGLAFVGRKKYV